MPDSKILLAHRTFQAFKDLSPELQEKSSLQRTLIPI